jgi:MFS family permease
MLGFVSMFMDISSELIHSLLPVFMVSALGASALAVGIVEGVGEATALITKVFSGTLSDYWGRRKVLAVLGYGLSALSKPLFALAGSINAVLAARFTDRIGKGMRGAPRDALVADLTPEEIRGAAYGLRQALDTVGAFVGPLMAMGLMFVLSGNFRNIFWFSVIPALFAVILLGFGVQEPKSFKVRRQAGGPIQLIMLKELSTAYWWVVMTGAIFTLARFSEAFLVLRAMHMGLSIVLTPAVLILMNIVYASTSYPAGRLADRMDRRLLLGSGLIALIAADLALAQAGSLILTGLGIALWGLHLGLTQGLLSAMVASAAPAHLRGTAFGFFNLACGITMLASSAIAGLLWDKMGAFMTFYAGAVFSIATLALLTASPRIERSC